MNELCLSKEDREWLASFKKQHGRPPRVLHIGNIANNAYNNAKLLNMAGLDCDVICYDYYHIMACPEWEDADFEGKIADQFRPDWTAVTLNGFERPAWFAQGPLWLCADYLIARRSGRSKQAARLWTALGIENGTRSTRSLANDIFNVLKSFLAKRWERAKYLLHTLLYHPNIKKKILDYLEKRIRKPGALNKLALSIAFALAAGSATLLRAAAWMLHLHVPEAFAQCSDRLMRAFADAFPARPDKLTVDDLQPYAPSFNKMRTLFEHYDIIQAYSTDPIIPLLAGKAYVAFEHGTLRDIPFASTPQGRMSAISYRLARHVFVTNFDCLDNAHALAGDRVTLINHPYDEDHGLQVSGWEPLRQALGAELDAEFLFFFPTRHDWVIGTGYADKGNDVFLRAFAELRRLNHRVGMVCCNWGRNVPQSKRLLDELGCASHVKWLDPMGMIKFERMARACHCVVDQFKLGAFGGVMFKAMAVGSPVCTFLDETRIRRQYPEMPPVVNCRSEREIVQNLPALIASPHRLFELGAACRAWMKRYHTRDAVIGAQIEQYRRFRCA